MSSECDVKSAVGRVTVTADLRFMPEGPIAPSLDTTDHRAH